MASQLVVNSQLENFMSLHQHRKPLLRFETTERAQLISSSMPSASGKRKRKSGKRNRASSSAGRKPKVIKGRVNIRVAGYSGLQKIAPSTLIPYLPANKLKQAAKKALGATGKRKTVKRKSKKRKRT